VSPVSPIVAKARREMVTLYCDSTIRNGKTVSRLAKLAPAPSTMKSEGNAQQISVEEDANSERKFAALSFI
jgi:hypothetical protein